MTPTEATALAAKLRQGITPGPWVAEDNHVNTDPDESAVCICVRMGTRSLPEATANARLIAAAPDLLDAVDALAARVAELEGVLFNVLHDARALGWHEAGDGRKVTYDRASALVGVPK